MSWVGQLGVATFGPSRVKRGSTALGLSPIQWQAFAGYNEKLQGLLATVPILAFMLILPLCTLLLRRRRASSNGAVKMFRI